MLVNRFFPETDSSFKSATDNQPAESAFAFIAFRNHLTVFAIRQPCKHGRYLFFSCKVSRIRFSNRSLNFLDLPLVHLQVKGDGFVN